MACRKNNIAVFEIGCHKCANLMRVGKKDFICTDRVHMDDTPVIPIKDGVKTDDWNICDGKHRKYVSVLCKKGRSKSG